LYVAGARAPVVHLVGAGPGDPELLTLKAIRTIRQGTVLLVDDLVDPAVLRYARRSARIVRVGKRGACASTPQAFIERVMVAEALRGERVVRLKGGDPFVFGRGGEEAAHLRAHGIDVVVVDGVTSGLAAARAIGVPCTHRDHAHGVLLVTGHVRSDTHDAAAHGTTFARAAPLPALHWPTVAALAAQGVTVVVYMGVATAPALEAGLLEGGLPAATPVAIVQHATLPQQRHAVCTLDALAATIARERLASPAVLVIGDVVRAAAHLRDVAADREQPHARGLVAA
jgi:uroporphyrin-III C-methyltransferase